MSAKQRAKARIKQRLVEKLNSLTTQEDALCSLIKIHVDKVRCRTQEILAIEDTNDFLQQYAALEQHLDKTFSTCELITATAEDMIESQETDIHETVDGKEEPTMVAIAEATSTIFSSSMCESSCGQDPRSSTPVFKPVDAGSKQNRQENLKDGKLKDEKTENQDDPVEDARRVCTEQTPESEQDTCSSEEKFKRDSTQSSIKSDSSSNKVKGHPEHLKKSDLNSEFKTVPSCVKKTLETYEQSFEGSTEVCEASDQESFNKRLEGSKADKKSSPKKKQKSPKKKTSNKKDKTTKEKTPNLKRQTQAASVDSRRETKKSSDKPNTCERSEDKQSSETQAQHVAARETTRNSTGTSEKCANTRVVSRSGAARDFVIPEDENFADDTPAAEAEIDILSKSQSHLQSLSVYDGILLRQELTPVIVSEIVSPWCFFVQPHTSQLKQLMAEIREHMSSTGLAEPHLNNPCVGTMCLAQFNNDKAFYRACIYRVQSTVSGSVSYVDVLYLDYGNKEKVKVTDLRRLPENFKFLPPQAACCALAEVMPANKYCVWTEEDILTFKHYVCNQQLNCIRTCSSSTYTIPHLVKLVGNYPIPAIVPSQYVIQPVSIGQFLINRGSAKYLEVTAQIKQLIKTEEGKEEATILHGSLFGRPSPRIREISQSTDTTYVGNHGENSSCHGDNTKLYEGNKSEVKVTEDKGVSDCAKKEDVKDAKRRVETGESDSENLTSSEGDWHPGNMSQHLSKSKQDSENKPARKHISGDTVNSEKMEGDMPAESLKKEEKPEQVTGNNTSQDSLDSGLVDSTFTDTHKITSDRSTSKTLQSAILNSDTSNNLQGHKVMLANIRSPGHFYVHIVSQEVGQTLDSLMKNLNRSFERTNRRKLANLSKGLEPLVNTMCCAQFSQDDCFYRALIKSVSKGKGGDKIFVHYVDFGDEEWICRNKIFPLPSQYKNIPPLATCCSLAFIKPKAGKNNSETEWTASSTDRFTALAGFEKALHMHIVQGIPANDKTGSSVGDKDSVLGVLLVDNTSTEEVCINLELIRQGEAELNTLSGRDRTAVPDIRDGLDLLDTWNPMKDDFLSKRNSYRIDVDDAGVAATGYKAQDEKRICKFFARGQQCWRGDRCTFRHIMTDSGVSLDQDTAYVSSGNQDSLVPAVGSWVALEVTTILSPERFYAILPLGRKSLDAPASDQDLPDDTLGSYNCDETLDDLLAALNKEYSSRPSFQGTAILKSLGEIVAAKFSQDQQWYRGRITEVTEDKVKVFYVDFGNTEWLPEEEVAEIKPEFLHLPFQSLECFLYNVEPAGSKESWSKEARNTFRELVDAKTLVGLVRSSSCNNCLTVELFDTSTDDDLNVGDVLIEKGFAIRSNVNRETSGNITEQGSSRRSSLSTGSVNFIPG